ncbi:MAG: MerR family transcriptional regulator [Oscillospiraceae bacterium]|nr:MerR family transcriptional regulator [Oscillospiraceae bacterium]
MKTVKEVSVLTGVSVRTLQYYDKIGLLSPAQYTQSGYRLYDTAALERLQQILLFRELGFSLAGIAEILDAPDFDRSLALAQQIELLTLQAERLQGLIAFARGLQQKGGDCMDFQAFDKTKLEDYARRAKEQWGHTEEYRAAMAAEENRTPQEQERMIRDFMRIFTEFGGMKTLSCESEQVGMQVDKLQQFITDHYYPCTDEILCGLAGMYEAGGEFTENIDAAGGAGTAAFTAAAIRAHRGRSV